MLKLYKIIQILRFAQEPYIRTACEKKSKIDKRRAYVYSGV